MNKVRVFILDDNFPKLEKLVDSGVFDGPISEEDLLCLLKSGEWKGERKLRELTSNLLTHSYVKQGWIEVVGYSNPSICLSDLDMNRKPNVIIYDWEYGNHSARESETWLLEILEMTDAFVFVYSAFSGPIPAILNKKKFDEFAARFQLFSKGGSSLLFSSEEFIYQYILSRVSINNVIKVGGIDVTFKENGYLKDPHGILDLEAILGRASLLDLLNQGREISNESIEKMISTLNGYLLLDDTNNFLIASGFPLESSSATRKKIDYLDALRRFGVTKLKETMETGFAKI